VAEAVNHLRAQLAHFVPTLAQFSIRDVHAANRLWEFDLNDQTVRGTTDIIIAPGDAVQAAEGVAPEILACFEFKDPPAAPGPLVVTDQIIRQVNVELMAACVTSSRPLICFITDMASGARAAHIAERADGDFDIIEADLTLNQMGSVLAALLRPQYSTVQYSPTAAEVAAPGPVRNGALFRRKFEETYESSDAFAMMEDLLEEHSLPKHQQLQAVREFLTTAGLHSNLLEEQETYFRHCERSQQEGCGDQRSYINMYA
jgi:hypothetical protein